MKDDIKLTAIKLRKNGYSIGEIAGKLSISKSTVSVWVRDVILSDKARKRIRLRMDTARIAAGATLSNKRKQREKNAENTAKDLFKDAKLTSQCCYMLAALIYECEGAKTSRSTLEFTNSDPVLIAIFLKLVRTVWKPLDESKFRVVMHLHSYHNESEEKKFWAHITGIPEVQFLKTFKKTESGNVNRKNYRGCVQIKYFDVNIKRMLLAGKPLMAKELGL